MSDLDPPLSTAAMLAIGDEILSGRTKDKNIGHLADILTAAGIDLKEVRIVSDEPERIAAALNDLRTGYTYVFTSGGIGPTHDDVTADAVGLAFGLPVDEHPEAVQRLSEHYAARDLPFTPARRRMTRTPEGATLIDNPVSVAPGFRIGNVFVMAGVPAVFRAMVDAVLPTLPAGRLMLSRAIPCAHGEGVIGDPLAAIQKRYPGVAIGSYPKFGEGKPSTELVLRSRDEVALDAAADEVRAMVAALDQAG
ncbi:competence/damage-inducible protein A [Antarcticirhabdus aurantiaca]|uniref:Competence/damage-inducible protein A n=1 Tax=Antarcticirhabdus aurantiaca TaxID=2606717 RepID=A0ACD4NWB3_9HYPH|nr:competence/damage-inducible protein A [Antarcticirhabdus aurantiaca]WAJ31215.1 competence/damage-inducible protein A [Jeongeuplla avenae]